MHKRQALIWLFFLCAAYSSIAALPDKPIYTSAVNPMRPLAVSADGEWVVYGDGSPQLRLVSAKSGKERPPITLPDRPIHISLSHSAQQVLVNTLCGGIGLVDISREKPEISWITEPRYNCIVSPQAYTFEYRPAAISPDDETFALYGPSPVGKDWKISTYSVKDRKPLATFPLSGSGSPQHVEFSPNNRFLLVIESAQREDKNRELSWNTVYSLWDLYSLQLHSRFSVRNARRPSYDAAFSLSDFSGEGWTIRQQNNQPVPELVRFPLQGCSAVATAPSALSLVGLGALSSEPRWAADSFGRWLAVARMATRQTGERQLVDIFDVSSSAADVQPKMIATLVSPGNISQMRSAPDGMSIWATLANGRLTQFDIPSVALQLQTVGAEPMQDYCVPADEAADARKIDSAKPTHVARKIIEIPISPRVVPTTCPASFRPEQITEADGSLFIDVGPELILFDLATGNEVRRIPAPLGICSLPMPEDGGFLTFQGDTVAIRSWAGGNRELVTMPGWKVGMISAGFNSAYSSIVFVNWMTANIDPTRRTGTGISAAYSLKNGKLIAQTTASFCPGGGDYPQFSCDRAMLQLSDDYIRQHTPFLTYTARVGDYHGLEVRQRNVSGEDMVIFRQGVKGEISEHGLPGEYADPPRMQPEARKSRTGHAQSSYRFNSRLTEPYYVGAHILSDSMVLGIKGATADLYDFRNRRLIATLDQKFLKTWVKPVWHEESSMLWVRADAIPGSRGEVLQGWRVEKVEP